MLKNFIHSLALILLLKVSAIAQTGSISGVLIDKETKETIIGAYVTIKGTDLGTTTDFDGVYILRDVPVGMVQVLVGSLGYEEVLIDGVEVKSNQKTELNVSLGTTSKLLNEVTIVEYKKTNTEAAVLLEVKQAKQVVSAISSQQISRSQDGNAAQVMQRVPGVTIVDNRFVMIRGLPERYNNVMVNNVIAPSTEVDKRTFSFDLISSGSLDRMLVFKSGSADLPGDFAGGIIKLFTVDNVDENFTKLNLGVGFRQNTTFQPYFQSQGSSTDFLGFDNGFRGLPSSFPSTNRLQGTARNSVIRQDAAHTLTNNFSPQELTAMPDFSVGFSFGRNFDLKNGRKLSVINSINYSQSYLHFQRDFFRYFEWEDFSQPIQVRFDYLDNNYQKDNRISVMSNWTLRLSDKSKIKFKNLFNQIGENETILRTGFDFIQRPGDDLANYLLGYRSRSIYMGQLEGEHELNNGYNLRWVVGSSFMIESEPDLRRFRTFRSQSTPDANFTMQLPPSSNLFETGRYFGALTDFSVSNGVDITKKLGNQSETSPTLKFGYYADYRGRTFDSRYISYLYPGFFDPSVGAELSQLPLDKIFSNENIRTQNGFVIEEGTRPIDSYTASNALGAGYASIELPIKSFNITAGLRGEFNNQVVNSSDDRGPIEVDNSVLSALPFLNIAYNVSPKTILRLAYGRTVNRPEFRELAPFLFYDYKLEAGRIGNRNLRPATIDNIDLRYEFYPRNGEIFSVSAFYKHFKDPIENRTIITTEQPQFTYINADFAQNYGVEVEYRKSLKGMTGSKFIDNFSLNMNASLIFSEVDLGATAVAQDRVRPLQGQSPYIVNAAIYYQDENKFSFNVIYNVFGDRIFSVGDDLFPTIYERSRNSLDLTISKQVGKRMTYKIGVQDLLTAQFRFYQDSDRNTKIDSSDNPIFTFRRGSLVNFSISYNL